MPTDREQEIAFRLAGTVRLPSPAPASGPVSLVVKPRPDGHGPDLYLKVVHNRNLRAQVCRTISLKDVVAIQSPAFAPTNGNGNGHANGHGPVRPSATVRVGHEVLALVEAEVARQKAALKGRFASQAGEFPLFDDAVLYVPESAPVLLSSHAGMTAAESAGYLAPRGIAPAATDFTSCEDKGDGDLTMCED